MPLQQRRPETQPEGGRAGNRRRRLPVEEEDVADAMLVLPVDEELVVVERARGAGGGGRGAGARGVCAGGGATETGGGAVTRGAAIVHPSPLLWRSRRCYKCWQTYTVVSADTTRTIEIPDLEVDALLQVHRQYGTSIRHEGTSSSGSSEAGPIHCMADAATDVWPDVCPRPRFPLRRRRRNRRGWWVSDWCVSERATDDGWRRGAIRCRRTRRSRSWMT